MTVWWRTLLPVLLLTLVSRCCTSPARQRRVPSFSQSLRLTRNIRTSVQKVLLRYKEQQMGDPQFVDRSQVLQTLPTITTDYYSWLHMKDWERLNVAARDLQTFWAHLESRRQHLEGERDGGEEGRDCRRQPQPTISQSIWCIQRDLQDLIQHVNSQLDSLNSTRLDPTSPPTLSPSSTTSHPSIRLSTLASTQISRPVPSTESPTVGSTPTSARSPSSKSRPLRLSRSPGTKRAPLSSTHASSTQTSPQSLWVRRLEGYVILRDLERYLSRLARDYTLLWAKQ